MELRQQPADPDHRRRSRSGCPGPPTCCRPALARRLLGFASPAEHLSRLPSRRVAGVDAAGLRLVPADPGTTIGAIDIWADPRTGLPVEVAVTAAGRASRCWSASFLELNETVPSLDTVTPHPAPGVGLATTRQPDIDRILNGDGDGDHDATRSPRSSAGCAWCRSRAARRAWPSTAPGCPGWCVLPLPHSMARRRSTPPCRPARPGFAHRADRRGDPHPAAVRSHGHRGVPPHHLAVRWRGDPGSAGKGGQQINDLPFRFGRPERR